MCYICRALKAEKKKRNIMKDDGGDESFVNIRYQHLQVLAMLLAACFVYSLALQYTLICCKEKGTRQFQNFSRYGARQVMISHVGGDKMSNNTPSPGGGNVSSVLKAD